ncbi:MAG: hypothetical protein AAGA20_03090 [Planctomycetota bacterium]
MIRSVIVVAVSVGVLAWIVASAISSLAVTSRSLVVERVEDGSFEVVEGWRPFSANLTAGTTRREGVAERQLVAVPSAGEPLRLSSVTIVDLGGDGLSRRVAHGLLEAFEDEPEVQRIDVRHPGDSMESSRLGELILVLERLEVDEGDTLGERRARFRGWVGSSPECCQIERVVDHEFGVCRFEVDVTTTTIGTPFHGIRELAQSVVDLISVPSILMNMRLWGEPAPPVPAFAIPSAVELDGAERIAVATGLGPEPLIQGARVGRAAAALGRSGGDDLLDRIDRAVESLVAEGWTRVPSETGGAAGCARRVTLRLGRTTAEWIYEQLGAVRRPPESSASPYEGAAKQRLEDPQTSGVLWVHAWTELSDEELLGLVREGERRGPEALHALAENLSLRMRRRLEELGATAMLEPEPGD